MPNPTEAKTRKELIDPALQRAGWDMDNPDQVGLEIPVDGFDPAAWQRLEVKLRRLQEAGVAYEVELPAGVSDYVLFRPNGEIIAVVEAKRTSIDPRLARAQTEFYVTELEKRQSFRPFGFMTNGREIHFWDIGQANPREVQGFFSPLDLENRLYLRRNQTRLTEAIINTAITDRAYQLQAIRRVSEAFEQGKRKALLVMATGTGKTRVAMSLVDVFLNTNQARRILFVADRDALVEQALTEGFQAHIPAEPSTRIFNHRIDTANRLYVVTLQTLSKNFDRFTPAFFDLIIFDEVHRSIFNKWNEVLHYFDARMIGLTATPAHFIDRNTFLEFECYHGLPTSLYTYEEAIEEGYLVDYDLYQAQTRFQRRGIRGVDLSEEERNALIEQGLEPDDLDFSGTDLEVKVSNRDTLRKQWEEIWQVCLKDQAGQLPGKTILFAMTQEHALRLLEVFEAMYPQHPGLAQVITYKSEYKGRLIEQIPLDSYSVKQVYAGIEQVWQDAFWRYLTAAKLEFLKLRVGPLLRYVSGVEVQAATFTSKVERLKLQIVSGQEPTATAQSIAEDVSRLPDFVFQDAARREPAQLCLSPRLKTASVAELSRVIETLADQMKNRRKDRNKPLELDLLDWVDSRGYIILTERGQPIYVEKYRELVDQRVLELVIDNPIIEAIERGEPVSDAQLLALERTLRQELGGEELYLTETNIRKAYALKVDSLLAFLRHLFGLEGLPDYQDIVQRQFADYIARQPFNADQVRFLRAVQNVFLQRHKLEVADLYDPPLTQFGRDAVERWFSDEQIEEMLTFVETLAV